MAEVQRYARLKGTIRAVHRTKIKTDRVKHAASIAKKKLDHATQQDEQNVNGHVSKEVNTCASETRTTIHRTAYNARRIRQKASRLKTKREYSNRGTTVEECSARQMVPPNSRVERSAAWANTRSKLDAIPKATKPILSKSTATSKSTAATPKPREFVRQMQVQRSRQTTQRTARTAQMAKTVSEQIRKRAASAARSASKAAAAKSRALFPLVFGGGALSSLIVAIIVIFGCGITLFGGSSESDYSPVSAEVEAYEPIIRQYAEQYHIVEYVDLIKAVMMQESGGQGRDPMQASECGYNTRFPRTPNGITDTEYSVNVGVQELAACLHLAKVENPVDMEHIRLALQGYNYGEGYISWAKSRYGGYSVVNAVEYSTMMAERNHWESYGDRNYVNHVLQYYPLGHAFLPGGGQALVEVARSQLGNVGGEPYWSWFGFPERVEWCACFVSWCADQCGMIESGALPKFSYCDEGISWFQSQGRWKGREYTPQPGDYIFFDWDHDGHANHVGIVESCENGIVQTIEGNSGDKCRQRGYDFSDYAIIGYGAVLVGV